MQKQSLTIESLTVSPTNLVNSPFNLRDGGCVDYRASLCTIFQMSTASSQSHRPQLSIFFLPYQKILQKSFKRCLEGAFKFGSLQDPQDQRCHFLKISDRYNISTKFVFVIMYYLRYHKHVSFSSIFFGKIKM